MAFGRVIFRCSFWRRIVRGNFPVLQAPFAASWGRGMLRMEGGENMHQAGVKCQRAALWAEAPVWVEGVAPTWVLAGILHSGCGHLTSLRHRRRSPFQIQPLCAPLLCLWLSQNRFFFFFQERWLRKCSLMKYFGVCNQNFFNDSCQKCKAFWLK